MQKKLELEPPPATALSGPAKDTSAVKRAIQGLSALALASCVVAAIPSVAAASPGCDAVNAGTWDSSVRGGDVLETLDFAEGDEIDFFLEVYGSDVSVQGTLNIYSGPGLARTLSVAVPADQISHSGRTLYNVLYTFEHIQPTISMDGPGSGYLNASCWPGRCPRGWYSASGAPPCTRAPLGYYVDQFGATAATPAPLGYYVDRTGASSATPAPLGYYVDHLAATAPIACPAGTTTEQIASTSAADCVDLDTTPPSITWVGGPSPDASYVYGSVPAGPSCTASDDESGPDTCTIVGYSTSVGTHTMTATASDLDRNVATEQRTYTVEPWTLVGFSAPIAMNGALNRVKAGQVVPLKFSMFAGAAAITDATTVEAFTYAEAVSCTALDQVLLAMPIEQVTAGKTVLRYDADKGQFIQNWQTRKSQRGSCYRVTMTTADASSLEAYFKLE